MLKKSLKLLFFLGYCAVLIGCLEWGLRRFVSPKLIVDKFAANDNSSWRLRFEVSQREGGSNYKGMQVHNRWTGWLLAPNLRIDNYLGDRVFHTNAKGLRGDKDFSYERNEKLRIMVLGDSYTMGEEVSDDQTYSHLLNEILPDAEVLNLGVHGFAHDQMLLYYEKEGYKYKPDIVVVGFIGVDMDRNLVHFRSFAKPRYELDGKKLKLTHVPVPTVAEVMAQAGQHWMTGDLFKMAMYRIYYKLGFATYEKTQLTRAILDELFDQVKKNGAKPVLVFLPATHEINPDKNTRGMKFFRKYVKNHDVLQLDLQPAFLKQKAEGVDFGSGHWNVNGHRLIATELAAYLQNQNLLAPRKD